MDFEFNRLLKTKKNQIKCCLNNDCYIVQEPVLLKRGYNAFKKCFSDPDVSTVSKCFNCHSIHDKTELLNATNNKAIKNSCLKFKSWNKSLKYTWIIYYSNIF